MDTRRACPRFDIERAGAGTIDINESPSRLSPLGLAGYPVLMLTSALHMLGHLDMVKGTGLVGLIPHGLFELVLPI